MNAERRDNQRVPVGPDYTVRFLVQGQAYFQVRIINLSPGGCFATVIEADAPNFSRGALLEQFTFEHPDLPHDPFTAQVAYTLGSDDDALDFMGLGIQFLATPRHIQLRLDRALQRLATG